MHYYAVIKDAIANDTGLANTILHIHGGLAILMVARVVSRRSLGGFVPFFVVVALELVNEVIDRLNHGSWRWPDTIIDLINTLFWPLLISIGVSLRPLRLGIGGETAKGGDARETFEDVRLGSAICRTYWRLVRRR